MIHLIIGNTGSGKTTYANKLKTKMGGVNTLLEMESDFNKTFAELNKFV